MKMTSLRKLSYLNNHAAVVLLAFGIVYACSLSFVYVDGDDATSIAFHALGRNASLQPPYSSYQGMMDLVLGILPAQEAILRITAITMTSLAAIGVVLMILALVSDWLGQLSERQKTIAALVILASSPEVFYLGMVYLPSVIAMCLILAAHLLVRRVTKGEELSKLDGLKNKAVILLSLLLFGLGAACRWDITAYGLVIVADLIIGTTVQGSSLKLERSRIAFGLLWGTLAVIAAIAAIAISGTGLSEFYNVAGIARKYSPAPFVARQTRSWSSIIIGFQPLFTPAFLLLAIIGFIALLRKQLRLAVIVVVGILPTLPFVFSVPKMLLAALPGMLLCVVRGFSIVWFPKLSTRLLTVSRLMICLLLVGPWLLGIQIYSTDTSWGPGFELHSYNDVVNPETERKIVSDNVSNRRISANSMRLTIAGGFGAPTGEGPRPLGGHVAVLLGGGWRSLTNQLDQERRKAIQQAISMQVPILQDDGNALIVIHLLQMGYTTEDPSERFLPSGVIERRFFNDRGEHLTVLLLKKRATLFDDSQLDRLISMTTGKKVVLYSGYSSTIKSLSELAPDAVQGLGPFSAILDVNEFRHSRKDAYTHKANLMVHMWAPSPGQHLE